MKIKIISNSRNINIPMPLSMVGFAIKKIPNSVFEKFCEKLPKEYAKAFCKENLAFLFNECKNDLDEYSGLEIVSAQKTDGTMISIVL